MERLTTIFTKIADKQIEARERDRESNAKFSQKLAHLAEIDCMDFLYLLEDIEAAINHENKTKRFRFDFHLGKDRFDISMCYESRNAPFDLENPNYDGVFNLPAILKLTIGPNEKDQIYVFTHDYSRFSTRTDGRARVDIKDHGHVSDLFEIFTKWAAVHMNEHKKVILPILEKYEEHYQPPEIAAPAPRKKRFGLF